MSGESPVDTRPTMQQIADAVGLSKSAVSLALRDNPRLPAATRKKVKEVAESMGYRRNPVVDSLMTQLRLSRTTGFQGCIALINCSKDERLNENHTFRAFREGLQARADQLGYSLSDFWLEEPGLRPKRLRQILDTRNIRGLVLTAALVPQILHERYDGFWDHFACAVVGITHLHEHMPCATNDQYLTSKLATEILLKRGYRRPALVVEPLIDELLDHKFTAGYLTACRNLPAKDRIDPLPLIMDDRKATLKGIAKLKPDVVLTNHEIVRTWLEEDGVVFPRDMGIAHLDWHEGLVGWAGMMQNNRLVGSAAADLVISQLHKNEFGPQEHPKVVMLESDWVDGASVRA